MTLTQRRTPLDPSRAYKPLDFGNGLVAGSVNDQGQLVALNTLHPQHGYLTLSAASPFPDDRWYDPAFVRRYRAALASPDMAAFGLAFATSTGGPGRCGLVADALPVVELAPLDGVAVELVTFAPWLAGAPAAGAILICTATSTRDDLVELPYTWAGALTLTRSSYAQLTEGGPIARPPDEYRVSCTPHGVTIENTGLGWAAAMRGVAGVTEHREGAAPPAALHAEGVLRLEPRTTAQLVIVYGFGPSAAAADQQANALAGANAAQLLAETAAHWEKIAAAVPQVDPPGEAWLVKRAIAYVLACCAVPVGETTCVITDHQLLPLAWTRDSYYELQPLFALRARPGVGAELTAAIDALIRRHLLWLFETAERPDGAWGRAYLTNGRCKDRVFQLDQQCYPLLELAEYVALTGDTGLAERVRGPARAALEMILARRAPDAWLFPTSETPADDHVEMPYHLSSQIVVWRTLRALAPLGGAVVFGAGDLEDLAARVRAAVYQHMVVRHGDAELFCYLADLQGGYRLYHDANDLPTALAPVWGFCARDDALWLATMAFAFTPENVGGYYQGRFAGLGSVHTPHPWPLGAVQELLVAQVLADERREALVWEALRAHACWDGQFCEAYDETTGAVASRHWFAWPGAALAMAALARAG